MIALVELLLAVVEELTTVLVVEDVDDAIVETRLIVTSDVVTETPGSMTTTSATTTPKVAIRRIVLERVTSIERFIVRKTTQNRPPILGYARTLHKFTREKVTFSLLRIADLVTMATRKALSLKPRFQPQFLI